MTDALTGRNGLRALAPILVVASAYFYFLLFAEFALLELARPALPSAGAWRAFLALLGVGGLVGSALAVPGFRADRAGTRLGRAFAGCAMIGLLALLVSGPIFLGILAGLVGLSLGYVTVTLAASLRGWVGPGRLGAVIGWGTGLAYAASNLPGIFDGPAELQAALAAGVAGVGGLAAFRLPAGDIAAGGWRVAPSRAMLWTGLIALLALVWLDSAAFSIIQRTPELKAVTWNGPPRLLLIAAVHLAMAVGAGWLLGKGRLITVLAAAYLLLAGASLALDAGPSRAGPSGLLYVAGVSLYSVALVFLPAATGRPGTAALVFALAGWLGSALGMGMAENLARIPPAFVAVAGLGMGAALFGHWRSARSHSGLLVLLLALALTSTTRAESAYTLIERGRAVYVAEGCIYCHSQYLRPGTADEERWGPLPEADTGSRLIGNRRQGPDLATVGARRSVEWNRLHLMDPQAVAPGSRMPSYAYLFESVDAAGGDSRGDALLAYLANLGADTLEARLDKAANWEPPADAISRESAVELFDQRCAVCHGGSGQGNGPLSSSFSVAPPDFSRDPWRRVQAASAVTTAARVIRFGVSGTPMAGHEDLVDEQIAGLARLVVEWHDGGTALALPREMGTLDPAP